MKKKRIFLPLLLLGAMLLTLCACRAKTGINATIDDAAFVVIRIYDGETVYETTVIDEEDVSALKEACQVLGEYEDGGYDHAYCELTFAGAESEIVLYPAYEAADYILTGGGTYYRTGMDRREELKAMLEAYGVFLS